MDASHVAEFEQRAANFLAPYLDPSPWSAQQLLDALRPQDEDWGRVFQPDWVEAARAGFAPMWEEPALPGVNPGQSRVRITAIATGAMLGEPGPMSDRFPGGYRRIAHTLQPGPVWLCWSFTHPDETRGMAHNGLVAVAPDRWAWFPKPWRALRPH